MNVTVTLEGAAIPIKTITFVLYIIVVEHPIVKPQPNKICQYLAPSTSMKQQEEVML